MTNIDFTGAAASHTATDDVTYQVTHRTFNTNLKYSCAHLYSELTKYLTLLEVF